MTVKNLRIFFITLLMFPFLISADDNGVNISTSGYITINGKLPSSGIGSTFINGPGVSNKEVIYNNINGNAILEGDILLGTVDEVTQSALNQALQTPANITNSIIIRGNNFRWSNNLIPYQFNAGVPANVISLVDRALNHWRANSNVEFILRTPVNSAQFPNFVNIIDNEVACWSMVGMNRGQQNMNIAIECGFGATVHEFGHTLGLWHEQSRSDRDQFVRINWANIIPGQEHNFNQHVTDGTDIGAYDYGSIMHYPRWGFGIVDPVTGTTAETITPLQTGVSIGQTSGLSTGDIASINQHYPPVAIPIANLNATSYVIEAGALIKFSAVNSTPFDGIATYVFNTGDGSSYTQQTPNFSYTYLNAGTYTIKLSVTDFHGNTASTVASVKVTSAPSPVARLYIDSVVFLGDPVWADAYYSTGIDLTYEFDMGDGYIRRTKRSSFTYVYRRPGTYQVRLIVTDSAGLTSMTFRRVSVR